MQTVLTRKEVTNMKKMCELCGQAPESEMRYGVNLCKSCLSIYSQAVLGDAEAVAKLSNHQIFPDATDNAIRKIIEPIAKQHGQIEALAKQKEQTAQHEQEREEYARSIGVQYVSIDEDEDEEEGLYSNIGSKIKGWAKGIFVIEAIFSIIIAIVLMAAGDLGLFLGLVFIIIGPLTAWISSWLLYAMGELVEKTCATERHTRNMLKIMLQKNKE